MANLDIYSLVKSVPDEAKKTIGAGRLKGFTDINPMWRIKMLTELFGPCGIGWYYDVEREWTEQAGEEICAFVDISLYIKINKDDDWSKPIHGTGGSKLATKERNGVYVSDECFKMATTDAISIACKQLGFGADVYWEKDASKYDYAPEETGLQKYCKQYGLSYQKILDAYKVSSEFDLTPGQITAIKNEKNHGLFKGAA